VLRPGKGLICKGNESAWTDILACRRLLSLNCSSCEGTSSPLQPPGIISGGGRGAELRQAGRHHPMHPPLLILDLLVPAVCGSSATAPHCCHHHSHCGGITASSRTLVTVSWLCWDTAAVVHLLQALEPQQAAADTGPQGRPGGLHLQSCSGSGCILHLSMVCSQRGRAWRSSYPISSVLSEEKEYKTLHIFPAVLFPSYLLLQLEISFPCSWMPLNELFPWIFALGRTILALELDQRPMEGNTEGLSAQKSLGG